MIIYYFYFKHFKTNNLICALTLCDNCIPWKSMVKSVCSKWIMIFRRPTKKEPLRRWFSNLSGHQSHLWGWLKPGLLSPTPEFLSQQIRGGAWESAFPASFQLMLLMMIQGPHFENHGFKEIAPNLYFLLNWITIHGVCFTWGLHT